MKKSFLMALLPALMLGSALVTTTPADAQRRDRYERDDRYEQDDRYERRDRTENRRGESSRTQDIGVRMEQEYGVVEDDTREGQQLNDQLSSIVERITGAVTRQSKNQDFRLRSAKILGGRSQKHDSMVNAFALPDGRIYVTLGLMRAVRNSQYPEDELAFVVGHEVSHVTQKHSANQQKQAMTAGLLSVLLGAATRSRAVGQIGQVGAAAYVSSFSRKDEYDADKEGLKAMRRAGYNPQAAVTMLKRLGAKSKGSGGSVNSWFSSHPMTENRVERVQEMIQEMDNGRTPRNRTASDLEREDGGRAVRRQR